MVVTSGLAAAAGPRRPQHKRARREKKTRVIIKSFFFLEFLINREYLIIGSILECRLTYRDEKQIVVETT